MTPSELNSFLDDFAQKTLDFAQACEKYQRGEINISKINAILGEANADVERFFSKRHLMDLGHLERYGLLQQQLDAMTVQLFEAEIEKNRHAIFEAIRNGHYFIVNITYNSIKSSIYMMYSKQKDKSEQEIRLAETQQQLETAQVFIDMLKVLEAALRVNLPDQLDFPGIQKLLKLYTEKFRNASSIPIKMASDHRVFVIFSIYVSFLTRHQPHGWITHLSICRDLLRKLDLGPEQLDQLESWNFRVTSVQPAQDETSPDSATAPVSLAEVRQNEAAQAQLAKDLERLEALFDIAGIRDLNFPKLENALEVFVTSLEAAKGLQANSAKAHRLLKLFESYVDFLSNVNFTDRPHAAAAHIVRCCDIIESLAQSIYERQMLEVWRSIPSSLSIICAKTPEPDAADADNEDIQAMLKHFHVLQALLPRPDQDEVSFAQIRLTLALYLDNYAQTAEFPLRASLDERVFGLFEKHVDYLYLPRDDADPELDKIHIAACLDSLEPLAQDIILQEMIKAWRMLSEES